MPRACVKSPRRSQQAYRQTLTERKCHEEKREQERDAAGDLAGFSEAGELPVVVVLPGVTPGSQ